MGKAVSMADDERIEVSKEVLSRILDGEAVLLDLASGTYFGLNEVGSEIWKILGAGATVGETINQIVAQFEVDAGTARRDLEELLGELRSRGLVELR